MSRRDFISKTHSSSYDYISPLHLDLGGKRVLITGCAWDDGVGFATALAFARTGASLIIIVDLFPIDPEHVDQLKAAAKEAGRLEPEIYATTVDISDRQSVSTLLEDITKRFFTHNDGGDALGLDVLVNNAAHQEPYGTLLDSDPETYWRTWQVNVSGLFNMVRSFLPLVLESSHRTIINLSSSGALSIRPGNASYRTSKLAILRWTEALQMEHEQDGLLAFCVNPGAIKTRMTINEPEELRNRLPHKPDIAGDTIVWLVAKRMQWLGGRYVSCPWDMEELVRRKEEIVEGDKLKLKLVM